MLSPVSVCLLIYSRLGVKLQVGSGLLPVSPIFLGPTNEPYHILLTVMADKEDKPSHSWAF